MHIQVLSTMYIMNIANVINYMLESFKSSSSSIFHGIGPLVDPFRSHTSRSLFNSLPWFLLPVGKYCFM